MPETENGVRPRHLRGHATFGDDPSGWCGCAGCDPREDCGCRSCRETFECTCGAAEDGADQHLARCRFLAIPPGKASSDGL